jgi:hypothetical protein
MFIAALLTIAKLWKQPRYPTTDECIRKCGIYTQEFYSARRNNDMWFEIKWIQLEDIILSEVSQYKNTKAIYFSHTWKIDPKDKHRKKIMIIYKLGCRAYLS